MIDSNLHLLFNSFVSFMKRVWKHFQTFPKQVFKIFSEVFIPFSISIIKNWKKILCRSNLSYTLLWECIWILLFQISILYANLITAISISSRVCNPIHFCVSFSSRYLLKRSLSVGRRTFFSYFFPSISVVAIIKFKREESVA